MALLAARFVNLALVFVLGSCAHFRGAKMSVLAGKVLSGYCFLFTEATREGMLSDVAVRFDRAIYTGRLNVF
jgi:hypothetical protein